MANTSVQRREFVEAVQSSSLAVSALKGDSRMTGVDVDAADLNHDGNISGTREAGALFDQVDRLDQDGSLNSLRTVNNGTATAVAPAVAAVGDLARAPGLQRKGRAADPGNDDILFIGMRRETQGEAQALTARGAGRFKRGTFNVDTLNHELGFSILLFLCCLIGHDFSLCLKRLSN